MIVVQDTFTAKYGRGDELVALFKEMASQSPMFGKARLLTDASGPFFQVITQIGYESLGAWESEFASNMSGADFRGWFARMMEVTESGRRDFYNLVIG